MADGTAIITNPVTGRKSTVKDPDAVLDYPFDWFDWLAINGDTYVFHTFEVENPDGAAIPLQVDRSTQVAGVITAWLSGGTVDQTHAVTCHLTTAAGRKEDQTLYVKIKEK